MTREQASSRVPVGAGAFRPGAAAGAAVVLGLLGARGSAASSSRTESVGCVVRGRSGRGRRRFRSSRVSRARMRSCAARPRLEPAPWLCLPFLRPITVTTDGRLRPRRMTGFCAHVCGHLGSTEAALSWLDKGLAPTGPQMNAAVRGRRLSLSNTSIARHTATPTQAHWCWSCCARDA